MPRESVSDDKRRAVVEAALAPGANKAAIAREHGVSREYASRLAKRATEDAEAEYAHWRRVREIVGPRPVAEMPDLDALVHTLETAEGLPTGPYYIYERGDATTDGWYVALLSETDAAEYGWVGVVGEDGS